MTNTHICIPLPWQQQQQYGQMSVPLFLPGLGVKEYSQIVAQHNRLRSRVKPMAANMQKMVCGTYCLSAPSVHVFDWCEHCHLNGSLSLT